MTLYYDDFYTIPDGEVIHVTYYSAMGSQYIFRKNNINCNFISLNENEYNIKGSFPMGKIFRKATLEEIKWLELCETANKFVSRSEVKLELSDILKRLQITS